MPRGRQAGASSTKATEQVKLIKDTSLPQPGDKDLKIIFKDGSRRAHDLFPSQHLLKDPETGKQRSARYIQGSETIWKDEQSKDVTRTPIHFTDGDLFVEKSDTCLQTILLMIIDQQKDLCEIKIDNPEEDARRKNASKRLIAKAHALITEKEGTETGMQELLTVGRYYQIDVDALDPESVINLLFNVAEKKSAEFIDAFNNPRVRTKALMLKGKNSGLFLLDDTTMVKAALSGDKICHVPMGVKPEDALTDFALSDKGKELVEYVETNL